MSDLHSAFGAEPGHGQQPSEEELRAYLMELRQADPAEFLMQAVNLLVTGAQAKIGMADGRFLIDALAGAVSAVQDRLPPQLAEALQNAVVQLQTAQVQAERELAAMQGEPIPPAQDGGIGSPCMAASRSRRPRTAAAPRRRRAAVPMAAPRRPAAPP